MSRITRYDICIKDKKRKEKIYMYLWITEKGKDNKVRKKIVCIDVNDAVRMADNEASYELRDQTQKITPKYIKGFDECISHFIRVVYESAEVISKEEYIEFCMNWLAIYKNIFYNRRYICEKFFERFAPGAVKEKYSSALEMMNEYRESIQKEVPPYYVERGGRFAGCYVDDLGRKRPLTERKYYEKRYDYVEGLKVCIRREW